MREYQNMTNEELVKLYQEGNTDVLEQLIYQNRGLIMKVYKKFTCDRIPYEDLHQEAVYAFMRNIGEYDPNKGAKFSTFIYPRMYSYIQSKFVKLYYTLNVSNHTYEKEGFEKMKKYDTTSLDSTTKTDKNETVGKYNFIPDVTQCFGRIENELYIKDIFERSQITERQTRFICIYFGIFGNEPKTVTEIAEDFGCNYTNVTNGIRNGIKKIRKFLNISVEGFNLKEVKTMV